MSNGYFTPDPGKEESMNCDVCGDNMEVQRNVMGPRGFASAMAGHKVLHDIFACPHREEGWHLQAYKVMEEAKETASTELEKMLRKEAMELVKTRVATKKVSKYF